jgi:hypothetical protein
MKTHVPRRILFLFIFVASGPVAWFLPFSMPRESSAYVQFFTLYLIEEYFCLLYVVYRIDDFVLSWISVGKVT